MNQNSSSSCPICSNSSEIEAGAGIPRILGCKGCAFVWVDRVDLHDMTQPDYEDYAYSESIDSSFEELKPAYARGLESRLRSALGADSFEDLRFLDIGCANGEYLFTAKELGFGEVAGVEIDKTAAERAQRYGQVVESLDQFGDQKFDVIQIKNVLSNLEDPGTMLAAAKERLNEGGVLLLDVLNYRGATSRTKRAMAKLGVKQESFRFGNLRPPYVINGFSRRSLRELAERSDLELVSMRDSYFGSDDVPYGRTGAVHRLGQVGSYLNSGPMVLSEWKKPAS